jgi:hypothetical protein
MGAGVGAALAVVVVVLAAFGGAGVANLGTQQTELFREPRAAAHEAGAGPAHLSAVFVEADALGHHRHIVFVQTGVVAMFTRLSAFDAGVNTGLVIVVVHEECSGNEAIGR